MIIRIPSHHAPKQKGYHNSVIPHLLVSAYPAGAAYLILGKFEGIYIGIRHCKSEPYGLSDQYA